jgi:branched-chain amino acid transport system substrate-binding protein
MRGRKMRRLIRLAAHAACTIAAVACLQGASAQEFRIGVAAPLSGPSARLGEQVRAGAEAAASAQDPAAQLELADDACSPEGGEAAAEKLAEAKVTVVVGFLCTEAIEAAMPILTKAGIPVITVGVRTNSLTDKKAKTGWPVYRLAPRADAEGIAVSSILVELWRSVLFAIIDDGTIYGRELAETLRSEAEKQGLQPVYVDTFRPQLENQVALAGRLRKAGATHVFVGGDLEDIAVLGRDAAGLGYQLTIAGGEALRASSSGVPLQAGTLMVGLPEWSEVATPASLAAIKARNAEPEGYSLPAYAAVEVAAKAQAETRSYGASLQDSLLKGSFSTAIGKVAFDDKGDLRENPYRLFRFDGTKFMEVSEE